MEDNTIQFPSRDGSAGMPSDRSGTKYSNEAYQAEKEAKAQAKQRKEMEKVMASPVTRGELNQSIVRMYATMEKLAQELRATQLRLEATIRMASDKGVYDKDEFVKYVREQVEWNKKIDELNAADTPLPLSQMIHEVAEWNNLHGLKIVWQHVSLDRRLFNDETLTLEEKLSIAAEMDMPEAFIQDLRAKDLNEAQISEEVLAGTETPVE